jgi:serine/threonine protein kinase
MREAGRGQLIGRTIAGKYLIEELLGSGAMGSVFRARQVALEKTVAIKVLHDEHAHDATFAARFHREAKAASRLNHPNSMQVIDFGAEPDGLLYIAMEYLDGRSLHRLLREEWPLAAPRIADILMQTLAALAVAHDMGVVHRDLKPENVMVLRGSDDDGRPKDIVKVCDFGIAKITDPRAYSGTERESNAPVTNAGFLVGTPEYMSPEQGRGEKLDPRSDLYSVGIILFEMLTQRVPFEAENAIGVVLKHITEVPPRPSELVLGVASRLETVCLRALAKTPEERYRSAREMRAELRAVCEGRAAELVAVGEARRPGLASDDSAIAPTVQIPVPAQTASASDDGQPKSTLLGTSATIPGSPARRALVVAGVALAGGVVLAATALMMLRPHQRPSAIAANVGATHAAPPFSILEPETAIVPADDPAHPTPLPPDTGPSHGISHGKSAPGGWSSPKAPAATGAGAMPNGAHVSISSSIPSGAPAASSTMIPPPATAPPVPPAPTLAAPVADAIDPSFDPERGYVEVGLVNAQGAREGAVRGAVRGIGLAGCYRRALRLRGVRATGTATLNLSFDEMGFARSAIVTGADFLPNLTRCLQGVSATVHISRSQVDSRGGTAEVILAFKVP